MGCCPPRVLMHETASILPPWHEPELAHNCSVRPDNMATWQHGKMVCILPCRSAAAPDAAGSTKQPRSRSRARSGTELLYELQLPLPPLEWLLDTQAGAGATGEEEAADKGRHGWAMSSM